MSILKVIEELKVAEEKKVSLEYLKKQFDSVYFEAGSIEVSIKTRDFAWDREGKTIEVRRSLFIDYIKSELNHVDAEIGKLIERMNEMRSNK